MRKMLVIAALAMSLGGCATTGGAGGTQAIITQIQQVATQACGFLPTANTVAAILAAAAGVPGAATGVEAIAAAICSQMTKPAAAKRGAPMVYGVPITGTFVK